MKIKTSPKLWCLLVVLAFMLVSTAATSQETPAPAELIQSVSNPHLGQLDLPGFWTVEEIPDGLRAEEEHGPNPASMEISKVEHSAKVKPKAYVEILAGLLAGSLNSAEIGELQEDEKGVFVEIKGEEEGRHVRYAILARSAGSKVLLVAALGAPTERFDALAPRALLSAILDSVK